MGQHRPDDKPMTEDARADHDPGALLDVLRNEIWPLPDDPAAIAKAEREQLLGYDPATGV